MSTTHHVSDHPGSPPGAGSEAARYPTASDLRDRMPEIGLREYWYPAIAARQVGKRKPVLLKLLNEELVLFRDQDGEVAALQNACPHRGMPLALGDCHFPGTVSCPYHGWTFNTTGDCVAVLGEGPDSAMVGKRDTRARVYPTQTLKGIVFVWMGQQEPAPIAEDVPEEFFDRLARPTRRRPATPRPSNRSLAPKHGHDLLAARGGSGAGAAGGTSIPQKANALAARRKTFIDPRRVS